MSIDEPRARAPKRGLPIAERLLRRFTDAAREAQMSTQRATNEGAQGVDGFPASGRAARRGARLEAPHPQHILLQRADEAFRDTVAFGLPHEARGALDAEEGDVLLEIVGQIVRPVVVT